jgi:zinc/manganese transport system substrate-binding protein
MPRSSFSLLLAAILIAGCAPAPAGGPPSAGTLPKVLATETFLGDIAQNVAGNRVVVDTLLPVGVDPHEFQLTPRDTIQITQSQLLVVNGLGYETWLNKSLRDSGTQRLVIVASDGLTANPDPTGEHPAGDPHMWMNPLNVVHYVENVRDGLSKADPAGAAVYASNANAYITQLNDLDQWIRTQVATLPINGRLLVTNHDALGYFSAAYGFKLVGAIIPSVTSEASPSARQMADLIQTIKSSGAPAIFLDVSENQDLARQIASESGARVVTDLYVETLSAPDGPAPTYLEMLKHDVTVIVQALR